jgi:toxin ParE1/3/4
MLVRWTKPAVDDLTGICDYTAEYFGAVQARRAAIAICESVESLGAFPNKGRLGRKPNTRELGIPRPPFVVVYRVREGAIEITRILHGAQDWPPHPCDNIKTEATMLRTAALPLTLFALTGLTARASAQNLPVTTAETIDGKKLQFPTALRGSIVTCVFGFGKDSSDKAGVWLESLRGDGINAWSVVNLETVPAMARSPVRISMRKGTPKELLGRSLIVSKFYKEWKQILEIQQDNLPVVVLFDADGMILWKRRGTFSAGISDELKAKIAELAGKKP